MPARKRKKNRIYGVLLPSFIIFLFVITSIVVISPQVRQIFFDQLGLSKNVKGSTCRLSGDIMLITDVSDSMKGPKLQTAINAAKSFVDIVASYNTPTANDRIGLVTFAQDATLNIGLTTNYSSVKSTLDGLGQTAFRTCMSCGVTTAAQEIQTNGRPGILKVGIILTDGKANWVQGWPSSNSLDTAQGEAAANTAVDSAYGNFGMPFYTIGLGQGVNQTFLQSIADRTGAIYYFTPGLGQLQSVYQAISQQCPINPPPISGTPFPTLTPPPIRPDSISGSIYVDYLNNGNYTIPPDTLYTSGISVIDVYDTTGKQVTEATTTTGQYATGTLPGGKYIVSYTSLPTGYFMTFPRNGPPPSFSVTVDDNCDPGNNNDGYCVNGSAKGVNFGITNIKPWYQSVSGDLRIDGSMKNASTVSNGVTDPIPLNPSCGSNPPNPYVITSSNGSNNAGVVFSGNNSYDFGKGQASQNNYVAGGNSLYPEVFTPVNKSVIRTSYSYMMSTAKQSGLTPTELTSLSSCKDLTDCTLLNTLPHGLYHATGDVYLNTFPVPKNQDYVLLIDGNLHIMGPITIPADAKSTFTVSTSGTIYIDPGVGNSDPTDTKGSIAGFYSADKSFIVQSKGLSCANGNNDKRFNLEGALVVNAGMQNPAGNFENDRDLCINNFSCPAVSFIERPDMILHAPTFIKHTNSVFQEVAP